MSKEVSTLKLKKQIEFFRQYLVACEHSLEKLLEYHDWENDMRLPLDWIQANWELLFERELLPQGEFLAPLSVPINTRVIYPDVLPTFFVSTNISDNLTDLRTKRTLPKNTTLRFCGLCTALKNGFGYYAPFDLAELVLDATKELFVVPLSLLEVNLTKFEIS